MQDVSSRPHYCPRRTLARTERRILAMRISGRPGYHYLHKVVDDHSRLAYTEILSDERKDTAADFWERARAYFESCGITVTRVLADNGSCYRSHAFAAALEEDVKHKRTRPYQLARIRIFEHGAALWAGTGGSVNPPEPLGRKLLLPSTPRSRRCRSCHR